MEFEYCIWEILSSSFGSDALVYCVCVSHLFANGHGLALSPCYTSLS